MADRFYPDGNFWIPETCDRCDSLYYVHAMQNVAFTGNYLVRICPWCSGLCSAAEQDHHKAWVESEMRIA